MKQGHVRLLYNLGKVHGVDITHDNVRSSMLSCFYSHLLSTGRPISSSDCPRVAKHALVLGSSGNVQSNPTVPTQHTKPGISAIQPGPSQEPVKSELTCLAPRASLRQWQHELRLLKEDQPDLSMRQSGPFLQSGASVIRWTSGHHL